ncbi:MAG: hypothetical protein GYA23_12565, partial [Methanomicrobiales archaeon]|nr:hypothetical protein [Methanomicrobiales archaeon]
KGNVDKVEMLVWRHNAPPLPCLVSTRVIPFHGVPHVLAIIYISSDGKTGSP